MELSGVPSAKGTGWIWIDGTLGGAGHACSMIEKLGTGDLFVGMDRDPTALERSIQRIERSGAEGCRVKIIHASYERIPEYIRSGEFGLANGILLDLGLSSDQLTDETRGFSFRKGGPLDLRFDPSYGVSARDWLLRNSEEEIARVLFEFGEERFSRRIAAAIVRRQKEKPIDTAEELTDIVHRVVPGRIHGRIDSATRTFQALRIVVNRELEHLAKAMQQLPECLVPGGRLLVITFHSLEDRIVKHAMRDHPQMEPLTKKPILPTDSEIAVNPRARSAKLRVAQRIAPQASDERNISAFPPIPRRKNYP